MREGPQLAGPPGPTDDAAPAQVLVGSVWIDAVTFQEAIDRIAGLVEAGAGGSVFTPNVDHVVTAEDDAAFRAAYARADLCLADGQPLVWATRWLGTPVPQKISGSDLVGPLLERAAREGWRVYLLGGAQDAAAIAALRLERELGLRVVGHAAPRLEVGGSPGEEEVVEAVRAAAPDLLLVGLGAPKQERFIDRVLPRIRPAVALGVGASIDFLAGRVRRAPGWISRAGLEWLFRLVQEPRRLAHRYLAKDPRFIRIVARTARMPRSERLRSSRATTPSEAQPSRRGA